MGIFKRNRTVNSLEYIDRLNKEIAAQIEMNQELKSANEALKLEVMSQQKELARFEKNFRQQPLSQLQILHKELDFLHEHMDDVLKDSKESVADQMIEESKAICTTAFEFLNSLKKSKR